MKKQKTKKISYNTIIQNQTLDGFLKQNIDKTKDTAKFVWDLTIRYMKRK